MQHIAIKTPCPSSANVAEELAQLVVGEDSGMYEAGFSARFPGTHGSVLNLHTETREGGWEGRGSLLSLSLLSSLSCLLSLLSQQQ